MSLTETLLMIVGRELAKLSTVSEMPESLDLDQIRTLQALALVLRNLELPPEPQPDVSQEELQAAIQLLEQPEQ